MCLPRQQQPQRCRGQQGRGRPSAGAAHRLRRGPALLQPARRPCQRRQRQQVSRGCCCAVPWQPSRWLGGRRRQPPPRWRAATPCRCHHHPSCRTRCLHSGDARSQQAGDVKGCQMHTAAAASSVQWQRRGSDVAAAAAATAHPAPPHNARAAKCTCRLAAQPAFLLFG